MTSITIELPTDVAALVAEHVEDPEALCRQALADAVERHIAQVAAEVENLARRQAVDTVSDSISVLRNKVESGKESR